MSKMIYHGLFFNPLDVEHIVSLARLALGKYRLSATTDYPHVTFGYMTEPVKGFEPGKTCQVHVIGYGCDGRNEGLLVALDEKLGKLYSGASVRDCDALSSCMKCETPAHITTSYDGTSSKPVNTRDLLFDALPGSLIGLMLTGTLGWFDGYTVRYD